MIKINNLNKYYNKGKSNQIHVINETSIELPSKGLITFLGHSGSGKTTLLNVIGGLDKQTAGEIIYDDQEFKKYNMSKIDKFRSRHIGYVFQNYNLLLEETVYDNLKIALDLIGITDLEEQKKRIEYSLKAVGMFKYRKKVASFLSGGQQQRVSIARALVKKSKVIIADEPTGNLDSKNTIEVMNILKKISEQALVLLVTHENNVANFYSDIIYEIKDGKIIDRKEISNDVTFNSEKDDSIIYLKDMNESDYQTDLGNIVIHSDDDEPLKINLDIIVKNGNIYLKSDKPIKLVEQANLKIVNDNYKEMKRDDISSFEYDTSWYDDKKAEPKNLKKFGKRIANSFISFKAVGKKQKFIYLCLAFIGFIMGIGFSLFSNALSIDMSPYPYSRNINYVERTERKNVSMYDVFSRAYDAGEINDLYTLRTYSISYNEQITVDYSIDEDFTVYAVPSFEYNTNITLGKAPEANNEAAISKDVAKKIAEKSNRHIEDVIGLELTYNREKYKITGITVNDNLMMYLSPSGYELFGNSLTYTGFYYGYGTADNSLNKMWYQSTLDYYITGDTVFRSENYTLRSKQYEKYEISSGRDVDENADDYEVVISSEAGLKIGNYLAFATLSNDIIKAKIVGFFKNFENGDYKTAIFNKKVRFFAGDSFNYCSKSGVFEGSKNFDIIEGEFPKGRDEIMVSVYAFPQNNIESLMDKNYQFAIGDTVYIDGRGNCKIVGIYNSKPYLSSVLFNENDYVFNYVGITNQTAFNVLKPNEFNTRLKDAGFANIGLYQAIQNSAKASRQTFISVFSAIFASTAIASALFIYFVMRSKMLSDIYNIGVYRSLGASRFRINKKYMADILVLTSLTGLIGYIFGILVYIGISEAINSIFGVIINQAIFSFNIGIGLLGVVALYLVMYVFGMLPIVMLERKTPSEIIAKYDI